VTTSYKTTPHAPPPSGERTVIYGDALEWLRDHPAQPGCSVVASMPDVSEWGVTLPVWEERFREAARLCLLATPPDGVTVFFQTDARARGRWVSKGGIVLQVAAELGIPVMWHKMVLQRPPNTSLYARAGYSHLLAFSRAVTIPGSHASPDVLPDRGMLPWSHSMGTRAAIRAMRDIRAFAPATHTILQPFCGIGTALVVANDYGFNAVGIEWNRRRVARAKTLTMADIKAADAERLAHRRTRGPRGRRRQDQSTATPQRQSAEPTAQDASSSE